MPETTKKDIWAELRKPFDPKVVGKLPRGGTNLDYVGHAAVTDRLLNVDPKWSWEPVATDEFGSPKLDSEGNLWIKLTVNGVTRLGVGDGASMKVRIGDAIRNAAMRFGVALDLWSKDELESTLDHPENKNVHTEDSVIKAVEAANASDTPSDAQIGLAKRLLEKHEVKDVRTFKIVSKLFAGAEQAKLQDLNRKQMSQLIKNLTELTTDELRERVLTKLEEPQDEPF